MRTYTFRIQLPGNGAIVTDECSAQSQYHAIKLMEARYSGARVIPTGSK